MDYLAVKSVNVSGKNLIIDFTCKGQIEKFLIGNRFFAQYNVPIHNVPEQLLLIPFLSTVSPIAWANQTDITVKTIDGPYLNSLEKVQSTLNDLFPKIGFSGKIYAEKIIEDKIKPKSKSMILFSGGIDSLATYIRHKEENPLLVAVHGAEVPLEQFRRWNAITHELNYFAIRNGLKSRTVRSNFYDIFDHLMGASLYRELFEGSWWIAVMHSLSFVGLCAPLTHVDDVGKIYIASSLTKEFKKPRGCIPEVDNKVYWSGTSCMHDGYDLSRQQKINLVADYAKKQNNPFVIRVCGNRNVKKRFQEVINCSSSKCEKCSRTIIGLELAGLDPNKYGFDVKPNFFLEIKTNIEDHKWKKFGYGEKFLWNDIIQHAKKGDHLPHPEAEQFIDWLIKTNIQTATSTNIEYLINRIVLSLAPIFKYVPKSVWKINRTLYRKVMN